MKDLLPQRYPSAGLLALRADAEALAQASESAHGGEGEQGRRRHREKQNLLFLFLQQIYPLHDTVQHGIAVLQQFQVLFYISVTFPMFDLVRGYEYYKTYENLFL